jgi:hypothetical protein
MKPFQDKINYKRLLAIVKINREKGKSFTGEIYITYTYILVKPWTNVHEFWSIWTKILENLEMYKGRLEIDKFASY